MFHLNLALFEQGLIIIRRGRAPTCLKDTYTQFFWDYLLRGGGTGRCNQCNGPKKNFNLR